MYRTLLKIGTITKLLSANMINRLGDGIDSIAFTWLTYALTKNASLSAIVFAANCPSYCFIPATGRSICGQDAKTKGYGVV